MKRLSSLLALLLVPLATVHAAEPSRPNIVFLLADDLGRGDLHCYGHPYARTPRTDDKQVAGVVSNLSGKRRLCQSRHHHRTPKEAGLRDGALRQMAYRPRAEERHLRHRYRRRRRRRRREEKEGTR
ncbi:MAG: hypothetical protein EBU04_09960 [Verrucomicrobia bacterium]|nr:hypothetical protein [Verrucomicrobiota bacterium]